MAAGKKSKRAVIEIPDIDQVLRNLDDDVEYAHDVVDFFCGYDCEAFDNGLECPDTCPILHYHDVIRHNEKQDETEVLKSLGCGEE